jgi:heterodisulfide reductase subunit B
MISWAEKAGAGAVVTACPLCQSNLEMRQGNGQNFPVFYFTELLALAFDLKEVKDTFKKHLIDVSKVLKRVKVKI